MHFANRQNIIRRYSLHTGVVTFEGMRMMLQGFEKVALEKTNYQVTPQFAERLEARAHDKSVFII